MSNRRIDKNLDKGDSPLGADDELEKTIVKIRPNGPIIISGDFIVRNEKGDRLKKMQMISLCRCGCSNNPPFCDGTHFKHQFIDE